MPLGGALMYATTLPRRSRSERSSCPYAGSWSPYPTNTTGASTRSVGAKRALTIASSSAGAAAGLAALDCASARVANGAPNPMAAASTRVQRERADGQEKRRGRMGFSPETKRVTMPTDRARCLEASEGRCSGTGEPSPCPHVSPPGPHRRSPPWLDRLTRSRHHEVSATGDGRSRHTLGRLVPGVEREVERPPMDGKQQRAAQRGVRVDRLLGVQMDVGPELVVRADLHEREVERAVRVADGGEPREGTGIAAVEDAVPRTRDGPRRPERVVAVRQTPPREVTRRRRGEGERTDGRRLGPVELDDPVRCDAPPFEMRADAERDDEAGTRLRGAAREGAHDAAVEVIVVVVRRDDRV